MALICIKTESEIKDIFEKLNQNQDEYFLPIRGMLQFIISGAITTGKLYANRDHSAIAVLHEFKEFSNLDADTAAVYANSLEDFVSFFKALSEERRWTKRYSGRSVLLTYIRDEYANSVKSILHERHFEDLHSYMLGYDKPYRELTVPDGFILTDGTPELTEEICKFWNYNLPGRVNMFKWMLQRFPSVFCYQKNPRKLVAWSLTYSCGAGAAHFVYPEYRGMHLSTVVGEEMIRKHNSALSVPRYSGVSSDNTQMIAMAKRDTKKLASWLVFGFEDLPNSKL